MLSRSVNKEAATKASTDGDLPFHQGFFYDLLAVFEVERVILAGISVFVQASESP